MQGVSIAFFFPSKHLAFSGREKPFLLFGFWGSRPPSPPVASALRHLLTLPSTTAGVGARKQVAYTWHIGGAGMVVSSGEGIVTGEFFFLNYHGHDYFPPFLPR